MLSPSLRSPGTIDVIVQRVVGWCQSRQTTDRESTMHDNPQTVGAALAAVALVVIAVTAIGGKR